MGSACSCRAGASCVCSDVSLLACWSSLSGMATPLWSVLSPACHSGTPAPARPSLLQCIPERAGLQRVPLPAKQLLGQPADSPSRSRHFPHQQG